MHLDFFKFIIKKDNADFFNILINNNNKNNYITECIR